MIKYNITKFKKNPKHPYLSLRYGRKRNEHHIYILPNVFCFIEENDFQVEKIEKHFLSKNEERLFKEIVSLYLTNLPDTLCV